jgi:Flp pilus assembly protein TadB
LITVTNSKGRAWSVTFVVLFVLAVIWAVYLASWLRGRSEHRSVNSISSFNKHLSVLERTSPARQGGAGGGRSSVGYTGYGPLHRPAAMTRSEARRRRRDVLFVLAGAVLVTLMLAVLAGGLLVYLQLLADVALVGYLGLLVHTQRLAADRRNKVRYLAPMGAMSEIESPYLVPHSASANY